MLIKKWAHYYYKKLETHSHLLKYLFLEITQRCNLSCLHCGSDCKSNAKTPELTTESWIKIVDYFADLSNKKMVSRQLSFIITGGEPLLHPDLIKIGSYIHSKGFRWSLVTNGMLLSREKAKQLELAGVQSVTFSFDGVGESHNYLRNNPKAYEKLLEVMEILSNSSIPLIEAVSCIYPRNFGELSQMADVLIQHKISRWRMFRIFPSGRATNNKDLLLSYQKTQELLDWIKQSRKIYKSKLQLDYSCEGYMPIDRDLSVRSHGFFCWAGINIASILADGTITGCTNNSPDFYMGNILRDNFMKLWQNDFKIFRNREWAKIGPCKNCSHWKFCEGSSIHLWQKKDEPIRFCYVKELKN